MELELQVLGTENEYTIKHDDQGNEINDRPVVLVTFAKVMLSEKEAYELLGKMKGHKLMVRA